MNEAIDHGMEKGTAIRGHFFHLLKDSWPLMDQDSDFAHYLKGGLILIDNGMMSSFGSKEELSNRLDGHQVVHQLDDLLVSGFVDVPINSCQGMGQRFSLNQLFNGL